MNAQPQTETRQQYIERIKSLGRSEMLRLLRSVRVSAHPITNDDGLASLLWSLSQRTKKTEVAS